MQSSEAGDRFKNRVSVLEDELQGWRQSSIEVEETKKVWAGWRKDVIEALGEENVGLTQSHMPPEVGGIVRVIKEGKARILKLEMEKGEASTKLAQAERDVSALEEKSSAAAKESEAVMRKQASIEAELQQSKNSLRQLKSENGSLVSLMQTFEKSERGENAAPTGVVKQSEGPTVQALKTKIESLEKQNESLAKEHGDLSAKYDSTVEKFCKLRDELGRQKERAAAAEAKANEAELLAGKGSYNNETTRILHLSKNPFQEALTSKHEYELAAERELREQVEAELNALKTTGKSVSDASISSSVIATPAARTPAAKTPSVDYEKMNRRLKEQFSKTIGVYRDAVYNLTGYKVDMDQNKGQFKLRSMYAESEQDFLQFQKNGKGSNYDLLESDFAKHLQKNDIESISYLTNMKSTPAFLSNVTLSLFSQQTFLG